MHFALRQSIEHFSDDSRFGQGLIPLCEKINIFGFFQGGNTQTENPLENWDDRHWHAQLSRTV